MMMDVVCPKHLLGIQAGPRTDPHFAKVVRHGPVWASKLPKYTQLASWRSWDLTAVKMTPAHTLIASLWAGQVLIIPQQCSAQDEAPSRLVEGKSIGGSAFEQD